MDSAATMRANLTRNIARLDAFGRSGYVYGYPHKKAYRPLEPRDLAGVWRDEPHDRLLCYVHVPFCTMRCAFCNLFTYVPGDTAPAGPYLDALTRQMELHREAMPDARFTRLYIGGGTPTYLTADELRRLVRQLAIDPAETHGCIEASPETLDPEKVGVLREQGFHRLSLGVQSFVPEELRHVNRRLPFERNRAAVDLVGEAGFPEFNLDLIYGLPGQTNATWKRSLDEAVASAATSLFLYPLYVRPMTGLAHGDRPPSPAEMDRMYDTALQRLADAGFRQVTMRQFRRGAGDADEGWTCQTDGTVGLGAGARSYTSRLHYSTPWKMVARNIRGVVADYESDLEAGRFRVRHGFALDDDERRRRFVILSLLYGGLRWDAFQGATGADARTLFAGQWEALAAEGCVVIDGQSARLTAKGTRHADVVGQMFFSDRVRRLVGSFEYDA